MGRWASAAATATRCASPPESVSGRRSARWSSPRRESASRAADLASHATAPRHAQLQGDVVDDVELRTQRPARPLVDEAEPVAAQRRAGRVVGAGEVDAGDAHRARARSHLGGEHGEQRRLAGTVGPVDDEAFPDGDAQRHAAQRGDRARGRVVEAEEVVDLDRVRRHGAHRRSWSGRAGQAPRSIRLVATAHATSAIARPTSSTALVQPGPTEGSSGGVGAVPLADRATSVETERVRTSPATVPATSAGTAAATARHHRLRRSVRGRDAVGLVREQLPGVVAPLARRRAARATRPRRAARRPRRRAAASRHPARRRRPRAPHVAAPASRRPPGPTAR